MWYIVVWFAWVPVLVQPSLPPSVPYVEPAPTMLPLNQMRNSGHTKFI